MLKPRPRVGWAARVAGGALATAALLLTTVAPGAAQSAGTWTFEDDSFADLWFHGLAVVGYFGFGPLPLYDPTYARNVIAEGTASGATPTLLERRRTDLLGAFKRDEAFEILHFVPLYFGGVGRDAALTALKAVAARPEGSPETSPETRFGASAVAVVLATPQERRVLASFLEALDEEWRDVVAPRRARDEEARSRRLADLRATWARDWAPPLADFLNAEGFTTGTVMAVPALGAEGRFLARRAAGPLVVVGVPDDEGGPAAALSSLVRELCYPAVRRAFASFEARLSDRVDASRASDLTATRCGELLLERRAPAQVMAYRTRFGLPPEGSGRAFLSASGRLPGAAAWEGDLEDALLRELHL